MELITILNRCHHFRGFVYQQARFSPDKKSIEVSVRPRKGSAAICSRCHQTAPGYDQLAERRFEFIPCVGGRLPRRRFAACAVKGAPRSYENPAGYSPNAARIYNARLGGKFLDE